MQSRRKNLESLRHQLESERSSFIPQWRDLSDFILPRRSRFFVSDANKGDRRNHKIIDSTATLAARTLRSGMMAGDTNPARPWFRLTTTDQDLAEYGPVKDYLYAVEQRIYSMFLRSNLYTALPNVYGDMGVFGTGCMLVEENFDVGMHAYTFPIGSYCIGLDDMLRVRVFYREFRMTVRQIVMKFGEYNKKSGSPIWSKFSDQVKTAWDRFDYEQWVDVRHFITPNENFSPDMLEAKYKQFSSCYYESGRMQGSDQYLTDDKATFLRESGYDYFPVLAPRWEVSGEDIYGTNCPGMEALGDAKQLQTGEKRSSQAIETYVKPPMTGPSALRSSKTSTLPGDITYSDDYNGKGFRPTYQIEPRITELEMKQDQVRGRIKRAFYEDLFLMLSQSDRREITAREIDERHEEKMLALGPVHHQTNLDLKDPLIDLAFDFGNRQGMFPEPPEELQGAALKVEYISVMAQAQKLAGIANIERFFGFVGNLAHQTGDLSVIDKVDLDQGIDRYADRLGVDPDIVRTDEAVAEMRAQRAQQQQAAAQAQMIAEGAKAAKNLSNASLEGDSALKRLIEGSAA